jgi:hypothetical protein
VYRSSSNLNFFSTRQKPCTPLINISSVKVHSTRILYIKPYFYLLRHPSGAEGWEGGGDGGWGVGFSFLNTLPSAAQPFVLVYIVSLSFLIYPFFSGYPPSFVSLRSLKGQCHKIFCFWFFS